jgi:hypothetical protein
LPTKNKRLDRWRPIGMAIEAPQTLDAAVVADRRGLRRYLMRACLEARRHLGLPPLDLVRDIETETDAEEKPAGEA